MSLSRILWSFVLLLASMFIACSDATDEDGDNTGGGTTDTGTTSDAGSDGSSQTDTYVPPATGESLFIAYVTHTRVADTPDDEEWTLWITDEDCLPGSCDASAVTGDFTCQGECTISPNMDFVLWTDPTSPGTLKIAPMNGSFEVSSESRTIAQNVDVWQVGPEKVVYTRAGTLYAQPLAGGSDVELITITSQDGRGLPGGFQYTPQIGKVIVNIPTSLSAMDLWEVDVETPSDRTLLYHFIADVEETTGSFYQNQQQVSVSPDGSYVAIYTEALDNSIGCSPSASTSVCDDEYRCSSNANRCVSEQLLLHIINRSEAGQLSTPGSSHRCSEDSECGQHHECDTTVVDAAGLGVCAPGKLALGPYGRFACTDTPSGTPYLDAGEYEHVIAGPLWRSDDRVVFVGRNNCVGANIDVTDIVAVDLSLSSIDTVISSTGGDHGGPSCYDSVEMDFTPEGCNIQISRMVASPSGNTLVFLASSVRSPTDSEVWLIDAFGRSGKHDLTRDILYEVIDVQVFDR